ncbi:hypothetical protein EDD71_1274 [Fonticella tunisiensis]|uniref:Uncharacterized protein n=1 Tax=Fonticella tunisiensis TaxID=1096341 RepID=A0A4R7KA92_9CLOT|nr:hypothetical protein EDD71_1274 [Fonticella tunisiensis]
MVIINYFDCVNEIMIKNKNTLSIRWLGVFSTVKKLVERRLISPYRDINFIGEIEIKGQKKIQIRCCNKDNKISKEKGYLCFFDKISPSKFDYLICVYFDKYKNMQGHYIFTKDEVVNYFPEMMDINGNTLPQYKGLYIPLDEKMDKELKTLVDFAFENWEKIK